MKTTFLIIILIFILILISNLHSQQIPYGQEFQVNTWNQNLQTYPTMTALSNGGFFVCWTSQEQDGSDNGIFGQIFDNGCVRSGSEFQINSYSAGWQTNPTIAAISGNRFVVCWMSKDNSESGIFGQIVDSSGNKISNEFQINTYTQNWQSSPKALSLLDSIFVVCWESFDQDGSDYGIFGQIFDKNGSKKGNEFQVNTYSRDTQRWPALSNLNDGGFLVCWTSYGQDSSLCSIYCQLFDSFGNKRGSEFKVNSYSERFQAYPTVSAFSNRNFIFCWTSTHHEGIGSRIKGQLFNADGIKIGKEFEVNSYIHDSAYYPAVTTLSNDGFIILWVKRKYDEIYYHIYGQLYDEFSNKVAEEFRVNSNLSQGNTLPQVISFNDGGFLVCWASWEIWLRESEILGKRFPGEPTIHQLKDYSLVDPPNDATIYSFSQTFQWQNPTTRIECYPWEITFDFYIDTDYNFSNPQIIKDIQDTMYAVDSLAAGKTYFWKVLAKNLAGDSLWSTQQDWGFFIKQGATLVENADDEIPQQFELCQNYPNPFNSSTTIRFSLPQSKSTYHVTLKIYDIRGRLVNTLVNQNKAGGMYSIRWDGRDYIGNHYPSGIYFYSLEAESYKASRKILLIK